MLSSHWWRSVWSPSLMRTGWYAFGRSSFVKIQPGSAAKDVSRQLIVKGTQKWVSEMKFIEFISFRRDKSTVSQAHSCRKEVGQVIKSSVRQSPPYWFSTPAFTQKPLQKGWGVKRRQAWQQVNRLRACGWLTTTTGSTLRQRLKELPQILKEPVDCQMISRGWLF